MNIEDISDSLDKLNLDKETRDAIIKLIDAKINNDMNTFSEELKQTKESLQNQIKSEIGIMKWLLGIMIAILLAILAKSFI